MHRDISSGNVLIWTDPTGKKQGKLGDLEFAERCPSGDASPDPKIVRGQDLFPPFKMNRLTISSVLLLFLSRKGTACFMPVEIWKGRRTAPREEVVMSSKRPRVAYSLTAAERERELRESPGQLEIYISLFTKRESDPLQHHFTHDLECLWWLTLWSVTCRLGRWKGVSSVFAPSNSALASVLREGFLMYDKEILLALADESPDYLGNVYKYLRTSRAYLRIRYFELAEMDKKTREDPAEHARAYLSLYRLVNAEIPPEAPPLVDISDTFSSAASETLQERLKCQGLKRPHPDS